MHRRKTISILLFTALILVASLTLAEVPQMINYQGRLTEADGDPVADDTYFIKFKIYGSAGGDDSLWYTGFQPVPVTGGLFDYQLGSAVSLPDDLFSGDTIRFLGITVGGDAEITPRTRIITVPYAYQALRSDSAEYADNSGNLNGQAASYYLAWSNLTGIPADIADGDDVDTDWNNLTNVPPGFADGTDDEGLTQAQADDFYVDENGDTLTGEIAIDFGSDGNLDAIIEEGPGPASNLELYDNADLKSKLWGEYYGELMLSDDDGDQTVDLSARAGVGGMLELDQEDGTWGMRLRGGNTTDGATLRLYSAGGSPTIVLDADETGDDAAAFPSDAVSALEVLDEPGVGSSTSSSTLYLDGTVQTIRFRSITLPASGYVLVIGTAEATCAHFNGTTDRAAFGVSNVAGSFPSNQDVEIYVDQSETDQNLSHPVTVHGLFSASAGSNTFYFLAEEQSGIVWVSNIQFTLAYFPTAYGTVTSTKATGLPRIPDDESAQGTAMTAEDIAAEQAEAEAFNLARIEREMEEMRIKGAKLEERLLELEEEIGRNR